MQQNGINSDHINTDKNQHLSTSGSHGSQNELETKQQLKTLKRIELKCLEMKEMMLAQNHPSEYIELRISRFRQMLLKKEGLSNIDLSGRDLLSPLTGRLAPTASHSGSTLKTSSDLTRGKQKRKRKMSSGETRNGKLPNKAGSLTSVSPLKDRSNYKHGTSESKKGPNRDRKSKERRSLHRSRNTGSRSSSKGRHTSPSADRSGRSPTGTTSTNRHKSTTSPVHSPKSTKSNGSSRRGVAGIGTGHSPVTGECSGRQHRERTQDTPEAYSRTVTTRRRSYTRSTSPKYRSPPNALRDKSHDNRRSRSSSREPERWSRSRSRGSRCSRGSRTSHSPSRSRSSSIRRRKGSPSHLDRRRITRASSREPSSRRQQSRPNYPAVGQRSRSREVCSVADQSWYGRRW